VDLFPSSGEDSVGPPWKELNSITGSRLALSKGVEKVQKPSNYVRSFINVKTGEHGGHTVCRYAANRVVKILRTERNACDILDLRS
jgi:hypothetical protein